MRAETRWPRRSCAAITLWLERGILDIGLTPESFKTQSLLALRAKERIAVSVS